MLSVGLLRYFSGEFCLKALVTQRRNNGGVEGARALVATFYGAASDPSG